MQPDIKIIEDILKHYDSVGDSFLLFHFIDETIKMKNISEIKLTSKYLDDQGYFISNECIINGKLVSSIYDYKNLFDIITKYKTPFSIDVYNSMWCSHKTNQKSLLVIFENSIPKLVETNEFVYISSEYNFDEENINMINYYKLLDMI